MSIIENPFSQFNEASVGGIYKFEFIHTDFISHFPKIVQQRIQETDIQLDSGREWMTGYSDPDSILFQENSEESKQGMLFKKVLKGLLPSQSHLISVNFKSLYFIPLIIKTIDRNGNRILLGTPNEPMFFTASFSTNILSSPPGYNFLFHGRHRNPSPFLI